MSVFAGMLIWFLSSVFFFLVLIYAISKSQNNKSRPRRTDINSHLENMKRDAVQRKILRELEEQTHFNRGQGTYRDYKGDRPQR